jgi:hypothetical protein
MCPTASCSMRERARSSVRAMLCCLLRQGYLEVNVGTLISNVYFLLITGDVAELVSCRDGSCASRDAGADRVTTRTPTEPARAQTPVSD